MVKLLESSAVLVARSRNPVDASVRRERITSIAKLKLLVSPVPKNGEVTGYAERNFGVYSIGPAVGGLGCFICSICLAGEKF